MRRREFITLLGGAMAWPFAARAQKSPEMHRLAILHPSSPVAELTETGSPRYVAFFKELRQLGYVEGQNIAVERYSGEGRTEHYAESASEVVRRNPDLIVATTSRLVLNFKAATTTIPIVGLMADPVPSALSKAWQGPEAISLALVRTLGSRSGASVSTCCEKRFREYRKWDTCFPRVPASAVRNGRQVSF